MTLNARHLSIFVLVLVLASVSCADPTKVEAIISDAPQQRKVIAMSGQGGCLIDTIGRPTCWTSPPISVFEPGEGQLRFTTLAATWANSCGLSTDSLAYCWGNNLNGLLGDGTRTLRPDEGTPPNVRTVTAVVGGHKFVAVDMGAGSCGLESSGSAWCWGPNDTGILGNGTKVEGSFAREPSRVNGSQRFTILSGGTTICGLSASGKSFCWGETPGSYDPNIRVEPGDCVDRFYFWYDGKSCFTPTPVQSPVSFKQLAGGRCGLSNDGSAYCWGSGYYGELGDNTVFSYTVAAVPVSGGLKYKTLSTGGLHSCALTFAGRAYCCGWNSAGQLGIGRGAYPSEIQFVAVPYPVLTDLTFTDIDTELATCAIALGGDVWCWGLGYGDRPMNIGVRR